MPLNRPSSGELIASVREMMEAELLPALEKKSLAYHCRVSINVLKIVERELQQQAGLESLEAQGLEHLLGMSGSPQAMNAELVRRINEGDFDGDPGQLLAHFQNVVLAKIAIDNPHYSTYQHYLKMGVIACDGGL